MSHHKGISNITNITFTDVVIQTQPCPRCGQISEISLPLQGFRAYLIEGKKIQRAFPELDADTREALMTGYHKECWDADFAELVEEDDSE